MPRSVRFLSIVAALILVGFGLFTSEGISDVRWLGMLAIAWVFLLIGTHIPISNKVPTFNRTTIRTALVLSTIFAIISAQLVRIQVVQSRATYNKTATGPDGQTISNPRKTNRDLDVARGRIFDRHGELVADTTKENGIFVRSYPNPATSYVAGYFSPLLYGSSGLEDTWDEALSGESGRNPVDRTINELLNRQEQGFDLHLSLDSELQQLATDLLGPRKGAVVVLEAATGATRVFVSNPNFDPGRLFTSSTEQGEEASAYWSSLSDDPAAPFVSRANLGLYIPGSTFKTVTAAAAIDSGIAGPDDVYEDNGSITIDGRTLVENNRPDSSRSEWTLEEGLAWSLNVVFAQIGLQIGADDLWNYAVRFGFAESIPFDLPVSTSQIASSRSFLDSQNALADTAFGQGQLLVTPLHMAMIAATFAHGGKMMAPFLVESVQDASGDVQQTHAPEVWKTPIAQATADQVRDLMINAVQNGAVQAAITPGFTVGGKTGTAETGEGSVHSWFIGFIGDPTPRYAISVVLEEGSDALGTSVNIGQTVLQTAIESTNGN